MWLKRQVVCYVVGLLLLTGVATGCGEQKAGTNERAQPVELMPVRRGNVVESIRVTGTVRAAMEADVVASTPGKVATVLVDVGDRVVKGQVLVKLDSSDIQARVKQAEAGVAAAEAALASRPHLVALDEVVLQQAQAVYDVAKANYERTKALFDQGAASQAALEQTNLTLQQAESGLKSAQEKVAMNPAQDKAARAQLDTARAALEQARVALNNTAVRAPMSGIVAACLVNPGEMAQGPVVSIVAMDRLQVEIPVTEGAVNYLQSGQKVAVTVPSLGNRQLAGRVKAISPAAAQNKTYTAKVEIENPGSDLKPGMAAEVSFAGASARNVLLIPKNAVVSVGGELTAYTVKDNRAVAVTVATGIVDAVNVEIKGGLADGQAVVVKGQEFLADGQLVQVVQGGQTP